LVRKNNKKIDLGCHQAPRMSTDAVFDEMINDDNAVSNERRFVLPVQEAPENYQFHDFFTWIRGLVY
jgi:hypothetical protein